MYLPEAIMEGKAMGYLTDVASVQGQFFPFGYPSPGHAPVEMLYKYGSASFGTMVNSNRWVKMYQHEQSEVRRQPVGLVTRARRELLGYHPACVFGFRALGYQRVVERRCGATCITCFRCAITASYRCSTNASKPLGESKSDYDIFLAIAERLNWG